MKVSIYEVDKYGDRTGKDFDDISFIVGLGIREGWKIIHGKCMYVVTNVIVDMLSDMLRIEVKKYEDLSPEFIKMAKRIRNSPDD